MSSDQTSQPITGPLARQRVRAKAARQLTELLQDASAYIRKKGDPALRLSAALLLTASLAACDDSSAEEAPPDPVVSALTSEVRSGLPTRTGKYEVIPESVYRSDQGVYSFAWRDENSRVHEASVSQLKLAEGAKAELDMPASGDPSLYLPAGVPVQMYSSSMASPNPTPTPTGGSTTYVSRSYGPVAYWHPFFIPVGGSRFDYSSPTYHNPPATTMSAGDTVAGTRTTASAPAPSSRVTGLRTAVSGRSGGTGSGTAATGKSSSGVSSPSSGAFSGGKGGASSGSASS